MTNKKDDVLEDGLVWLETLMRERNEIEKNRNAHLKSIADSLQAIVVKIPSKE